MAIVMRCHLKAARRRASLSGCLAKFVLRMRTEVSAISKLPTKILTLPLTSATVISYIVQIFWQSVGI